MLNPGDIVLVPDPGYQTYNQGARFAGAEPVSMPLQPENDYLPDLTAIPPRLLTRVKILWLNYPHNPTGATATSRFFATVIDFARQHQILVCHDAAYNQVTFDGTYAPSILEVPGAAEVAVELTTLSKSHNMAGWRVGAALGNLQAVTALLKLKTHADSSHFRPVLDAATAAMLGDQSWLADRNTTYQDRRDLIVTALREMGLRPQKPRAALYIWCPLPKGWTSSGDFALHLLEKAHVSLAPGIIFGSHGEGYMRLSFVQPAERLAEAMRRIQVVLSEQ
jgi:LL-diaminopimelate aminotransferase